MWQELDKKEFGKLEELVTLAKNAPEPQLMFHYLYAAKTEVLRLLNTLWKEAHK